MDAILDKTITVFRYLSDKDIFERYYKNHLAKRLLLKRSISDDAERGMLSKLKIESGMQFTSKLEGMFNDIKTSSDAMVEYQAYLGKHQVRFPLDLVNIRSFLNGRRPRLWISVLRS